MPRPPVGADDDLALELRAELTSPQLERAGGDELEIIEVGVNVEDAHAGNEEGRPRREEAQRSGAQVEPFICSERFPAPD